MDFPIRLQPNVIHIKQDRRMLVLPTWKLVVIPNLFVYVLLKTSAIIGLKSFFKCVHQFNSVRMLLFCGTSDILPAFGFVRLFLDHAAFGIPESHLELRRCISLGGVFDCFPGPECQLFFIRFHLIVIFNHFEYGSGNVIFSGAAAPFPTLWTVGFHTITSITAGRQKELRFAVSLLGQSGNLLQGFGFVTGDSLSEKAAFSQIELRPL